MRLALLLAAAVSIIPAASGHAVADASSPDEGQRLDSPPAFVVVTFTEPVFDEGSFIEVRDAEGNVVSLDDLLIQHGARPMMRVSLPADLPDGAYRIMWQTYSQSDGHIVSGARGFAVGPFAPAASSTDPGVETDSLVARTLQYLAGAVAAGVLLFVLFVGTRPAGAWGIMAVAAAVHGLASFGLFASTAAQAGLSIPAFARGVGGGLLLESMVALGLASLAALWAWRAHDVRARWTLLAIGWGIIFVLRSRTGHATGMADAWVQAIHAITVSAWMGGLVVLAALVLRPPRGNEAGATEDSFEHMAIRFSRVAVWLLAAAVGSGTLLAISVMGPGILTARTWTTPWGWFFILKLAAFVAVLFAANLNRRSLRSTQPDHRALRRWVPREALLGALTLFLAAGLLSTGTPAVAGADAGWTTTGAGARHEAEFHVVPVPTAGAIHEVRFYLAEAGMPIVADTCGRATGCLTLSWWPASDRNATQSVPAVADRDGWWHARGVIFATPAPYTMQLLVQTATTYRDAIEVAVPVEDPDQ